MIEKRKDGWRAEDTFDFDGPFRMAIKTYKINGKLVSSAAVNEYQPGSYVHRYGMGSGGDFSRYAIITPGGRATEKNVSEQHARAISMLPELMEAAREHYRKFPIKEAA